MQNSYADENISLDQVCDLLGVSNSYFSTIFKKETGQSFVGYLTGYRMEQAAKLLIETKQKIEEESDRLMEVPYEIRKTNEELLVVSITYCYDKLKEREEYLQELTQDIEVQRAEIKQKVADKVELEESVDQTYGLMHALLGREVMNVFDHYK